MSRLSSLLLPLLLCGLANAAGVRAPEITDPAEAVKDPDFGIQGEYLGEGAWLNGEHARVGAQAIALGGGQFTVVLMKGGLPGDGWTRGDPRFSLNGKLADNTVTLSGSDASGKIVGQMMTVSGNNAKAKLELRRTVRHSPTEGAEPPEGAVVLFDGVSAENFRRGTLTNEKNLLSEAASKQGFGDYMLHIEFRLTYMPLARGQGRSNSGVYLHDCYEIQVLDSFGLEGENNECGGFYQLRKPDVNMCYPPLTWQTYDVTFTAPRNEDGKKVADARVMVSHNGVVIHPEFVLTHATPGRQQEGPAPRPLYLQGHGNRVEFRNIWLKEKK